MRVRVTVTFLIRLHDRRPAEVERRILADFEVTEPPAYTPVRPSSDLVVYADIKVYGNVH